MNPYYPIKPGLMAQFTIPATGKGKQADHYLKVMFGFIMSQRPVEDTQAPVLKRKAKCNFIYLLEVKWGCI